MTLEEKYHLTKNNKYAKYFSITEAYARRDLSREELVKIWKEENEKMKPYFYRYENPFMKIPHFFDSLVSCFLPGDDIVIQEKIDGSNAHMRISRKDPEKPEFKAYGQNYELNEQNSLDGFYYFVQDHAADIPSKYDGLDIYGEWLIPHSCVYPEEAYGEFYVFDVMEDGNYWTQDRVQKQIEKLITEGEISANWKQLEPKDYQSKVTSAVYKDCRKETPEVVEKLGKEFGRLNGLIVSEHLKAIIREENDSEGAV